MLKAKTQLKTNTRLKSTTSLKKSSKKIKSSTKRIKSKSVEAWHELRTILYKELEELGVVSCEIMGENCSGSMFASLAHSRPRRFIKTDEEMREIIFCCIPCHQKIESMSKEDMYKIVTETIKKRIS